MPELSLASARREIALQVAGATVTVVLRDGESRPLLRDLGLQERETAKRELAYASIVQLLNRLDAEGLVKLAVLSEIDWSLSLPDQP